MRSKETSPKKCSGCFAFLVPSMQKVCRLLAMFQAWLLFKSPGSQCCCQGRDLIQCLRCPGGVSLGLLVNLLVNLSAICKSCLLVHLAIPCSLGLCSLAHTASVPALSSVPQKQLLKSSFKGKNFKGESKDINWLHSQTGEELFNPNTLITS